MVNPDFMAVLAWLIAAVMVGVLAGTYLNVGLKPDHRCWPDRPAAAAGVILGLFFPLTVTAVLAYGLYRCGRAATRLPRLVWNFCLGLREAWHIIKLAGPRVDESADPLPTTELKYKASLPRATVRK